jgi:hypothetical protein
MLKVYKECCNNCLLSEDRIVSPKRAKEIIKDCVANQTHFICHKASIDDEEIVCSKFYNTLGQNSQLIRIAQRLDVIEFVEQPEAKKLLTHKEISKNNDRENNKTRNRTGKTNLS